MNNIGLMVTKNEAPILRDVMDINTKFMERIYVLDGGDDSAEGILKSYPAVVLYVHERELSSQHGSPVKAVDGIRGYLLDIIRKREGEDIWITLMHGDEAFYHDPNQAICLAEKVNADLIGWYAPHFFPHVDEWPQWEHLKKLPLRQRFRHYAHYGQTCWTEHRQFKLRPSIDYEKDKHSGVVPQSPVPWSELNVHPLYHHFKVWDTDAHSYSVELFNTKYKRPLLRPRGKWSNVHYLPMSEKGFFRKSYPGYPAVSRFEGNFEPFEVSYNNAVREMLNEEVRIAD